MKIIRVSTDNEISVHDFPEGSYSEQNQTLRKLIGPCCELYEHVMPNRLYSALGASNKVSKEKGACVSMLVDEEALYHDLEDNLVGSYLYESDKHGWAIAGNILFVGETWGSDGIDFCGIAEDQFSMLLPKLKELVEKARNYR
ncbi:MAG: hypothetical protein K1W37_07790 [Lachnospiraceae bacterium]